MSIFVKIGMRFANSFEEQCGCHCRILHTRWRNIMNRIKSLIAVGAFSLLVLGIPAIASAQYNGQYDPYGRNGGYNNGGYNNGGYGNNGNYGAYGNNGYYGDIRGALRDLKQRSNDFHREVDR